MSLRSFVPGNKLAAETRPTPLASHSRHWLPTGGEFLALMGRLFLKFRNPISNLVMAITISITYSKKPGSNRLMW